MSNEKDNALYEPKFQWSFLHPKYWPTWLGIGVALLLAFLPFRWRDALANRLSKYFASANNRAKRRAVINIDKCFPEKSEQEKQTILEQCYATAAQVLLGFAELTARSSKRLESRSKIIGEENLFPLLEKGEKVIMLVPHCWAIDLPAMLFASRGIKVVIMIRSQANPIGDWLMYVQRMKYGGRIYPRDAGVRPFIKSIREGYLAYYLPDEDHGFDQSVFVPFLGTEKATLKGFGKLARLSGAKVVPMMPSYNAESGQFEIEIKPALENMPSGDEVADAVAMNQAIEGFIREKPEQYMWILNLLRSQPDGSQLY